MSGYNVSPSSSKNSTSFHSDDSTMFFNELSNLSHTSSGFKIKLMLLPLNFLTHIYKLCQIEILL